MIVDVTEQHQREQKLLYESTHDSLTGLRNRGRLTGELAAVLAPHRGYGQRFGLIYLDIDDFPQ